MRCVSASFRISSLLSAMILQASMAVYVLANTCDSPNRCSGSMMYGAETYSSTIYELS